MTRGTLLAAALLALAGCSGFGGPGGTADLTPAPVPPTPTPTDTATMAPSADGPLDVGAIVTDAVDVNESFALARAHHRALRPAGFTRVERLRITDDDGVVRNVTRRLTVAPGGHPYLLVVEESSRPGFPVDALAPRIQVYYEDPRALVRLEENGTVTYFKPPRPEPDGPVADRTGDARIAGLLATFDVRPVAAPSNGNGVYVLRATRADGPAVLDVPILIEDPRNVAVRVAVTPSGTVTWYTLSYDATFEGAPVHVRRTVRFRAVGETSVPRPAWHDAAMNATSDDWVPTS